MFLLKYNTSETTRTGRKGIMLYLWWKVCSGHKCKSKFFLIVIQDNFLEEPSALEYTTLPDNTLSFFASHRHIIFFWKWPNNPSYKSTCLGWQHITETLRIHWTIKIKDITILVDRGSTYNFIQDHIVKFLGLPISHSTSFQVMVGNA